MEKLLKIQQTLKAPKNQRNNFGGFNYRSCEDILEAVKPLLDGAVLTLNDEIILLGNRFYVKATATFVDGDFQTSTTAFAREPDTKKGMDEPQITGTASSYARKYALNGLFLIDDQKDADTNEYKKQTTPTKPKVEKIEKPEEKPEESPEQKYIKLLREKNIYSEELHIKFNKMTLENKRKEYERVKNLNAQAV